MKDVVSETKTILAELNFNQVVLQSSTEIIILFYKNVDSENIIFGISIDQGKRAKYIDMGALALVSNKGDVILACSDRFFITSDLKTIIPQHICQTKDSIEAFEQIDYLNNEMRFKQKFSNEDMIIKDFAQGINYNIVERTECNS